MKSACFFRQDKQSGNEERAGVSRALLFVTIVFILTFVFLLLPVQKMLVVQNERTKEILLALPVADGEAVNIKFTHSVNLSPVIDCYQISGKALILQSTIFKTYGAGIPILDDGLGKSFKQTENGFQISEIDLPRTKVPVMLQMVPDHRILYREKEIRLLDVAKSGTVISIEVDNLSFIEHFLAPVKTPLR